MEVDNIGSGELYLLKEIGKVVSNECLIAISLDAHANITDELCDYANIISGFKFIVYRPRYFGAFSKAAVFPQIISENSPSLIFKIR